METLLLWMMVLLIPLFLGFPVYITLSTNKAIFDDWIKIPFYGLMLIIILCQNLIYLDISIRYSSGLVIISALTLWVYVIVFKGNMALSALRHIINPSSGIYAYILIYTFVCIPILALGVKYFYGKAWYDQINYIVQTQFLINYKFSDQYQDLQDQYHHYQIYREHVKRIGQSVILGFFSFIAKQNPAFLFQLVISLSSPLTFLSIRQALIKLGVQYNQFYAICLSLVVGFVSIQLESFLSHALAIPFIFIAFILLNDFLNKFTIEKFIFQCIICYGIFSIYGEFLPLYIAIILAQLLFFLIFANRKFNTLIYVPLIFIIGILMNILNIEMLKERFNITTFSSETLEAIYPWKGDIKGFTWPLFGDISFANWSVFNIFTIAFIIILTISIAQQLYFTFKTRDIELSQIFIIPLLFIAGLILISLISRDKTYQFYKILLTSIPFIFIFLVLFNESIPNPKIKSVTRYLFLFFPVTTLITMLINMNIGFMPSLIDKRGAGSANYNNQEDWAKLYDFLQTIDTKKLLIHPMPSNQMTYRIMSMNDGSKLWAVNYDVLRTYVPAIVDQYTNPNPYEGLDNDFYRITMSHFPVQMSVSENIVFQKGRFKVIKDCMCNTSPIILDVRPGANFPQTSFNRVSIGKNPFKFDLYSHYDGDVYLILNLWKNPDIYKDETIPLRINTSSGYSDIIQVDTGGNMLKIPVTIGSNSIQLEVEKPSNYDEKTALIGIRHTIYVKEANTSLFVEKPFPLPEIFGARNIIRMKVNEPVRFWLYSEKATSVAVKGFFKFDPSKTDNRMIDLQLTTSSGFNKLITIPYGWNTFTIDIPKGATELQITSPKDPPIFETWSFTELESGASETP